MAYKIIFVTAIMLFIGVSLSNALPHVGSGATPARNVQLTYDLETGVLHIEADHPSSRLTVNYIRKVVVTKTTIEEPKKPEIQEFFFTSQTTAAKFIADLPYTAKAEDHLEVKLFVSLGGTAKAEITIPKPPEDKTKNKIKDKAKEEKKSDVTK